jgi:predicted nucleic acid-binding protein
VKLVIAEPESEALRSWIAERPEQVSSVLAAVEVRRAVLRLYEEVERATSTRAQESGGPADEAAIAVRERTERLLRGVGLIAVDEKVISAAGQVRPPKIRTLDAIHVATALTIPSLEALVTYDDRLSEAARTVGLAVVQPGR